jgi:hypothetical protein
VAGEVVERSVCYGKHGEEQVSGTIGTGQAFQRLQSLILANKLIGRSYTMSKLVWCWGYDHSIMYVLRIYQTRFLKRWKCERVRYFYTQDFTDVQAIAEDFVNRANGIVTGGRT